MRFIQSIYDFPQMVTLGDKTPSFGLQRFRQGLRFAPVDDEGFCLRGDNRHFLYKGRRRSHRFTILGDGSFEYDCILKKEPDSNVIRLRIDGAEYFNFYRQPDFVDDPLLKGSYAVYKKETLIGEGTGKLCHIHRPEIIDARGRRCWGTLAVIGNELHITIPEKWLGEAAYPVVVDPVIGTTTIGSHNYFNGNRHTDNSGNVWYDKISPCCMDDIILNKVLISENIGTLGTFYVYKDDDFYASRISRTYPCLYSNINNLPNSRISVNEQEIIDTYAYEEAGWLQAGISKNFPVNAGDYIWFGVRGRSLLLRFDYGGILEKINVYYSFTYENILLPDVLDNSYYSQFKTDEYMRELKISMYLTYDKAANHFTKTIVDTSMLYDTASKAQTFFRMGIVTARVNDTASKAIMFFRKSIDITGVSDSFSKAQTFFRKSVDTARIDDAISKVQTLIRKCVENARLNMTLNSVRIHIIICSIIDNLRTETRVFPIRLLYRKVADTLKAEGFLFRRLSVFLKLLSNSVVKSVFKKRFLTAKIELILKSRIGDK
jgi:hypothetical protein